MVRNLVIPATTYATKSLLFTPTTLYWPMYLLNLAFPLVSRWGRHVPIGRLVTDPVDPSAKLVWLRAWLKPSTVGRLLLAMWHITFDLGTMNRSWVWLFEAGMLHYMEASYGFIILTRSCLALQWRWFTFEQALRLHKRVTNHNVVC